VVVIGVAEYVRCRVPREERLEATSDPAIAGSGWRGRGAVLKSSFQVGHAGVVIADVRRGRKLRAF
jgi:hypothetical protein